MTLNADFDLDPVTATTRLTADLVLDGKKSIVVQGSLNDSNADSPLNMTAQFNRFPLTRANAFIPGDYIWLDGYAVGNMTISGSTSNPQINGYFVADSATLNLPRYGSSLTFASDRIPVENNVITFNNYRLTGSNRSPVTINGKVDLSDLDDMVIDLRAVGREVQFMNSKQDDFTQLFGKGLADIDATVKSQGNMMRVRANATLLNGSNITYVMKDEITQLTNTVDENMVTFTDFNNTTGGETILMTANGSSATDILANIQVDEGAKINVSLSEDGQNRATVDGSGRLKYSIDFAGRDNLTGSYVISSGNLRYTPPLISQKNFDISSGSSITWTGDMLNPQLNLKGTERLKTSVSSNKEGAANLVEFLIDANVGGTLSNIDLSFDLKCENDKDIQNELLSMSDNQRSQAAINLLLYNTYSGKNSMGSINNQTASSALFSFLQSKLNTWAAQTLPGIDLSFGINQYQGQIGGGTETSYSYRLAKSLFNDRFKIVVGGEYSTEARTEEDIASNLFNDISLEYFLNDAGNRYLRLFRHASYESVLDDQVIETGIAYVLKRKLTNLKNLFTFKHSREYLLRDSLEKARKAELKLQEKALDAIQQEDDETLIVPPDGDNQATEQAIDKPTVNRKKDESEQ